MIKRIQGNDQIGYHQNRFNRLLLPDVNAAGPISASLLGELSDPMKFLLNKSKAESSDMAWGSMVDMMWLTPEDWRKHFIDLPDKAPKKPTIAQINAKKPSEKAIESIDWWNSFNRKALGKTVIDKATYLKVEEAVEMLNLHPISRRIFENSEKQIILAGESGDLHPDQRTYKAKAMMDLLPYDGTIEVEGQEIPLAECVVDLKQCHDVSEFGMKKAIRNFQYHIKTEWYLNMLRASGESQRKYSILIFQNSAEPRDVHVRKISEEDLDWARLEIVRRITLLSQLNHKDQTNLFDTEVQTISTSFKS